MLETEEFWWNGQWESVEGSTLAQIVDELDSLAYDEDELEVYDRTGELVGFVTGTRYRYA